MFADLHLMLSHCQEKGFTPFIGGDFNARLGDLNNLGSWKYEENCDTTTNKHGRMFMTDICNTTKVYPVNHLKYKRKTFHGNFTYVKNEKKSQIDYVFTNATGRKQILDLEIIETNWHISDHKPVVLKLQINTKIRCEMILTRAENLNYEDHEDDNVDIKRYNKEYDMNKINEYMLTNKNGIERDINDALNDYDIELSIDRLNIHVDRMHQYSKMKKKKDNICSHVTKMNDANAKFERYTNMLQNGTVLEIQQALEQYVTSRKQVTRHIISSEHQEWKKRTNESAALWSKIDWKGKMNKNTPETHPSIYQLKDHFETIYETENTDETQKINDLTSNIYIPVLDDPITSAEINEHMKKCKKGGYDFGIPVMKSLMSNFLPIIIVLFNCMFYISYPIKLACSLLFSIPKKGNLLLPKNFRGIQMLPTLGVLFDRVIAGRLETWMNIHEEQTGFQKGKSTLHQIFTIRLLTVLAEATNETLYIGCFDIEKAFDKVSRLALLQKLIKLGIGHSMLNVLKAIYTTTSCILNMKGKTSREFKTRCGIRQGAPSSSLLFILFINDLIDFIKSNCNPEPLINSIHCLLHADDTLIISTNRTLFIKKCNLMRNYFDKNLLKLNLGKSGYLIINGKNNDEKCKLELNDGYLNYKSKLYYLGIIITDKGKIKQDIANTLQDKRSNITIKFTNFCAKNYLAPIDIKLKVLKSCVVSSLLYSCETWSDNIPIGIEVIHRTGIKTALGIRKGCCNEIAYIESGMYPLEVEIKKRQLSFWKNLASDDINQSFYITELIQKALLLNLPYVNYYVDLASEHTSPKKCQQVIQQNYQQLWESNINNAFNDDENSKLGTYFTINPSLQTPEYSKLNQIEFERITITRFRVGTHNLFIEKGRFRNPKVPRELRLCDCGLDIQTIKHFLIECPLLQHLRTTNTYNTVSECITSEHIIDYIVKGAKLLKIEL